MSKEKKQGRIDLLKDLEKQREARIQRMFDTYTEKRHFGERGRYVEPALKVKHQQFRIETHPPLHTGDKEDEEHVDFMRRMMAIALIEVVDAETELAMALPAPRKVVSKKARKT